MASSLRFTSTVVAVAALLGSAVTATTATAATVVATPEAAGGDLPAARQAGPPCDVPLPRSSAGDDALALLGNRLPEVARRYGRSVHELRDELRRDRSLRVDRCARLYYVDTVGLRQADAHDHDLHDHAAHGATAHDHDAQDHDAQDHDEPDQDAHDATPADRAGAQQRAGTAATADVPTPRFPLSQTFELASRPGSDRVIYLDFDGHTLTNTFWNEIEGVPNNFVLSPYSIDGSTSFSDLERAIIQAVWESVAEDFAPFDVNVTTKDPGSAAITRSSLADQQYGTRAVVTNKLPYDAPVICGGVCTGVAYLDVFDDHQIHAKAQPALIFPQMLWEEEVGEPHVVAEVISHEVGHNLALGHQGDSTWGAYSFGQGMWSPLMGNGTLPLTTWSNSDYKGAWSAQDDVATIAASGAPLAPDDHGDTAATARVIDATPASRLGTIGTRTDVDWFRFDHGGGPVTIAVTPARFSPNLDLELQVRSGASGGTVVATVDPPSSWPYFGMNWPFYDEPVTGLDASYTADLPAGTYHVRVDGKGAGNPAVDGYSDYGSLGNYTLGIAPPGVTPPPPPPPGVAPVVTLSGGPSGYVNTTSASFSFTSSITPATFECRLNNGAWASCTSPRNLSSLAEGAQTFEVRATANGITSATRSRVWTVDTKAPVVSISGSPANGSTTSSTSFSFTFSANEEVQAFECRLTIAGSTGTWKSNCGVGVSSGSGSPWPPGNHRVDVRARDLAGNLSATASRSWTISGGGTTPPPGGSTGFTDVAKGSTHEANIYELAARGVTLGCGGTNFCPRDPVTREQMATFLVRALQLAPGSSSPPFSDVTPGSTHAANIDAMRRESITLGCGGGRFCPRADVPREQMASFLQRALELPPGSSSPPFTDVRAGSTHARAIDAVRIEGITVGCGGSRFCPTQTVTREQMATFLVRALGW